MPAYAIQELVVTKDNATFTVMAADGNITERFEKNLTKGAVQRDREGVL